ncbi:heme-binding protein [Halanaerobium congolense]|nr:heme-binding protein [Halanaerobium congolense]
MSIVYYCYIIKKKGVIGTITVSGLKQEEDYNLVVESLKIILN